MGSLLVEDSDFSLSLNNDTLLLFFIADADKKAD